MRYFVISFVTFMSFVAHAIVKTTQMQARVNVIDICQSVSTSTHVAAQCAGGTPLQISKEGEITTITY